MDWFLRSLLAPIAKYVASHFPQSNEDELQVALKFDLIYAQSSYVYIVIPDLPRSAIFNATRSSHVADAIVGTISNPQPYAPPPVSYVQPQGGKSSSYIYPFPNISHGNSYLGPNMPYAYPHPHQ